MTPILLRTRVGADGVLRLELPVGMEDADREVEVTIDSIARRPVTPDEWRRFVESTGGSIPDPTFQRHPQGEYEVREELP